jgi:predicted  nucleic acid-binding Zn-ribbon protein
MMTAPIFGLMSTEAKLQARIKKLEKSKTNLMERLAALKDATEIFQLTKSNTDLRTAIKALERKVQRLLNARVEAKPPMNLSERMSLVEKTLGSVLGQDGVVTIK